MRQAESGDGFRFWRLANAGALVSPLFYTSLLRHLAPTSVVAEEDGATVGFAIARLRAQEVIEILDVHCESGATTELLIHMLAGLIELPAFANARHIDFSRCSQKRVRDAIGELMQVALIWPPKGALRRGQPHDDATHANAS